MGIRKLKTVILTILGAAIPKIAVTASACPGCAAAMDATLGRGFNMSTLFMIAMPFLVFGSIAIGIVYIHKNNKNYPDQLEEEQN